MLDYAEKDGETLLIVTADHETGGFAITGEDEEGAPMVSFISKITLQQWSRSLPLTQEVKNFLVSMTIPKFMRK